jgi:hypothetical protein
MWRKRRATDLHKERLDEFDATKRISPVQYAGRYRGNACIALERMWLGFC